MPRFFFNIREGDLFIPDPEGSVLPDIETAREVARDSAREMLIDHLEAHKEVDGRTIEIADAQHRVLDTVRLSDVLRDPGR